MDLLVGLTLRVTQCFLKGMCVTIRPTYSIADAFNPPPPGMYTEQHYWQ